MPTSPGESMLVDSEPSAKPVLAAPEDEAVGRAVRLEAAAPAPVRLGAPGREAGAEEAAAAAAAGLVRAGGSAAAAATGAGRVCAGLTAAAAPAGAAEPEPSASSRILSARNLSMAASVVFNDFSPTIWRMIKRAGAVGEERFLHCTPQ